MAKRIATANVHVRLKCIYSGVAGDPGPGAVIELDAEEAERLIGLGAAEPCEAPRADAAPPKDGDGEKN